MLTWSVAPCCCRGSRCLIRLGTDRNSFFGKLGIRGGCKLQLLDPLDYDLLTRLEALGNDPVRANALPHLDRPKHGPVLGSHDDDLVLRLNLDHRRLRNKQSVLVVRGLSTNLPEPTGTQDRIRIGELCSDLNGSCTGRDLTIDLNDAAFVRIVFAIGLDILD